MMYPALSLPWSESFFQYSHSFSGPSTLVAVCHLPRFLGFNQSLFDYSETYPHLEFTKVSSLLILVTTAP
jgi:hypothetical protein